MTREKKIPFAVSILCLLSLLFWLYYWLFVASLDSGLRPKVTIVNHPDGSQSFPVTYEYDAAQRYRPYIPLVLVGVYGAIVGSVVGGIAFSVNRRRAQGTQPAVAIRVSTGLGVLAAVGSIAVISSVGLALYAFIPDANLLARALGIIFIVPVVCFYCGIPAILGSLGTSCLLHGLRLPSRQQSTPPP